MSHRLPRSVGFYMRSELPRPSAGARRRVACVRSGPLQARLNFSKFGANLLQQERYPYYKKRQNFKQKHEPSLDEITASTQYPSRKFRPLAANLESRMVSEQEIMLGLLLIFLLNPFYRKILMTFLPLLIGDWEATFGLRTSSRILFAASGKSQALWELFLPLHLKEDGVL